jgi:4-hydroxybenzoate polyprenyltransferase
MDLALPAASALLAAHTATGGLPGFIPFAIATLGAYAAITSSYVYNDYCDVDVDKVGMPDRPLPSAMIGRSMALAYSGVLFLLAAGAALYLNIESLVLLVASTAVISVYSLYAKRRTPLSWALVGLAFGLVPIGVWLAISPSGILKAGPGLHPASLILGGMICITDWGFTNCDASRDVVGDREKGIPTTPAVYGISATSKLVAAFWAVGVALSIWLWSSAHLGLIYLIVAALSGLWILLKARDFIRNPTARQGETMFYQAANYRAALFAAMIIDILLGAAMMYA